ncbi:MAG TPA: peptidylprolyl isomerase [Gaiellaceae bacterium]
MAFRRRLPLILLVAAVAGCGGGKKTIPNQLPPGSTDGDGCVAIATTPNPEKRSAPKPTKRLDASKTYDVHFFTNCGTFTIRLDVRTSPATTASFASLVQRHFFDHTIFHRIVPGFVVQGGDPTGTGTSGPGYSTVDPVPKSAKYTLGVVAMAKTQREKAGTAGSQFFIVTTKNANLPPLYAILGKVVEGIDNVERIGQLGDANTGSPVRLVEIQRVTLDVH